MSVIGYKKIWTNKEHTEYSIEEEYDGGFRQFVSEQQDIFNQWLNTGNTLPEEERVVVIEPPSVIDPYTGLTTDQRIARKVGERMVAVGYTQEIIAALLLNKMSGRNVQEFDDMNNVRMQIIASVYQEEQIPMPQG